jgi:serine/threonine protein kinase
MASREARCRLCGGLLPAPSSRCPECGTEGRHVADPLLGQNFGGYILHQKIGAGGIASLYEAHNKERRAVLKLLPHNNDKELNQRLRREAAALSQLQHPFALKLYEQGEERGFLWLAMEHLAGETLEALLEQRGALPPKEVLEILSPLCEVIEEAHQRGIIHRDVTPSNIMLTGSRVTLLDFGFAWLRDGQTLTETGAVSGTPQYMSPEQWKGLRNTDARTDIYSLGVIAFECLSGTLPLSARGPLEWLMLHEAGEPPLLSSRAPHLPPGLSPVLAMALSRLPERRPRTALLFRDALNDAIK